MNFRGTQLCEIYGRTPNNPHLGSTSERSVHYCAQTLFPPSTGRFERYTRKLANSQNASGFWSLRAKIYLYLAFASLKNFYITYYERKATGSLGKLHTYSRMSKQFWLKCLYKQCIRTLVVTSWPTNS